MPIKAFIEMGSTVHPSVNSLLGFVALIIVPFNLFKYILISVIVFFIYKRIRGLSLKGRLIQARLLNCAEKRKSMGKNS